MNDYYSVVNANIRILKGVGEQRARLFEKLGCATVRALLSHYPRRYIDYTAPVPLAETFPGEVCVSRARVLLIHPLQRVKGNLTIQKVLATDDNTDLLITFFNNPYAARSLQIDREYLFCGQFEGTGPLRRTVTAPQFVPADAPPKMEPVYPLTAGLSSRMIASAVQHALKLLESTAIPPTLPASVEEEYNLCDQLFALKNIHFPTSSQALAQARRRLCVEELLTLQLAMFRQKKFGRTETTLPLKAHDMQDFYRLLPFSPTNAQRRAVQECLRDLTSTRPMRRLLQGDVGSGKTAVAAALLWLTAQNGRQAAMMAPTEILAHQHYESLRQLLGDHVRMELLTGSLTAAERRACKARLASGETQICIGTHALITQDVTFSDLALVVTDEQHRFGVSQRSALAEKGRNTHMLVMSATPIPRTLALIIYGDLDVSILDELPPGRQKIETYRIDGGKRHRAFNFIRKLCDDGQQAYIVCPLVAEGDNTPENLVAAETYAEKIAREDFAGYRVGLLHARMKAKEKDAVMEAFAKGEVQILVSTTVIEVGVDVPNATVMLIENAERFGLSQLHQLRGRVGRGKKQSYCILLSDARGEIARKRLATMCATTDGFVIAEEDLKLRGPGDFFGDRQHGLPQMHIADLLTNVELVERIQRTAAALLERDSDLLLPEHAGLREMVASLFTRVGEGGIS